MVIISPEQKVYSTIRKLCADLYGEENVFDRLPGDVPYPFIHIGDQFSQRVREHKDFQNKDTQIVLHVWHDNWKERGRVTGMMYDIERAVVGVYGEKVNINNVSIITDTSTEKPLMHGVLDVDIRVR